MDEWIDVKGRLPEFGGPVLVCTKYNAIGIYQREPIGGDCWRWIESRINWDYERSFIGDSKVTHWMPLPDRPK